MKSKQDSLVTVIGRDLFDQARPLALLLLILILALAVVLTTHNTRLLTARHEALHHERQALDNEWRNLLLEEKVLSGADRIERLAMEKLKMYTPTAEQEVIVKHTK